MSTFRDYDGPAQFADLEHLLRNHHPDARFLTLKDTLEDLSGSISLRSNCPICDEPYPCQRVRNLDGHEIQDPQPGIRAVRVDVGDGVTITYALYPHPQLVDVTITRDTDANMPEEPFVAG